MELTPRLRAIAEQVPQGARRADIGTDHGYLPVWLLLAGQIDRAIAADLREGPLKRARETAARFGMGERVDFRLCDGLSGIRPEEVDAAAIAGMGGETIASILEAAPWKKEGKLFMLQPLTGFAELRRWLQENGYRILKECLACEGKRLYSIWLVMGGEMPPLTPAEQWAGRQSGDPLRREYLAMIRGKVEKSLAGQQAARAPDQAAIEELEVVLSGLNIMEKELDTMTSVGEVLAFLQEKAPFELQEGFDNAGFLVGREGAQVSKILVSLDITEQVVEEAAELGKAALKLRRALDGKNPTPVSPSEALRNVREEMADVLLCSISVSLDEQVTERTIREKIPRWSGRIDHDPDSDCPGEDKGFHDAAGGYHRDVHRVRHLGHQGHGGHLPHMAAGLRALGDERVHIVAGQPFRQHRRRHHGDYFDTGVLPGGGVLRGGSGALHRASADPLPYHHLHGPGLLYGGRAPVSGGVQRPRPAEYGLQWYYHSLLFYPL